MSTISQSPIRQKINIPNCTICHVDYDSYYHIPRILPKCGHTFCQKCIDNNLETKGNRKVFVCVQCDSDFIIRKSSAEDLPKNIGILDIVKNLKKHQSYEKNLLETSPQKTQHLKHTKNTIHKKIQDACNIHIGKELDLICQTCNFQKVCSKCVLLDSNSHHNHKFVQHVPVSKQDLNQLKQIFSIVQDSINQTVVPNSPFNIIKKSNQHLIQRLVVSLKEHFQEKYYSVIRKKENQLIKQIKLIQLEGGIQIQCEKIIKIYDALKIQYENMFDQNTLKTKNLNISLSKAQEFISQSKSLHNQIEKFSDYAMKMQKQMAVDLSNRIMQSNLFRIDQLPFNLKNTFINKNLQQTKSPSKKMQVKSNYSNDLYQTQSSKSRLRQSVASEKDDVKSQKSAKKTQKQKSRSFLPPRQKISKTKETSSIDNEIKDIPALDFAHKKSLNKNEKNVIVYPRPGAKSQRANQSSIQSIPGQNSKISLRQSKQKQKMSMTQMQFSMNHGHKTTKPSGFINSSYIQEAQPLKIKYIRPSKQISFDLKSKFHKILKQIERQSQNQSLQLIGLDINDTLIVHVCQHLRTKGLNFLMLKIVKNQITDQGLSSLLGYLIENNSQTQVINLTSNQLTSKSLDLLEELGEKNNFLKTIYLSHNKVSSHQLKTRLKKFQNLGIQVIL